MPIEDYKRIVESLKLPLAVADARGRIVFANEALAKACGRPVEALDGMPLAELFARGDQKRVQQNAERVAQGKAGASFVDAELAVASAQPQWVQAALQPALDAKGKAAGTIAVLQDVSAQREAEEALNLLTARLLGMTEAVPVAILVETAPGDVELVNQAFCDLLQLGSAPQSLSGLPVEQVLWRSPRLESKALVGVRDRPEEGFVLPLEIDGRRVRLERQPIVIEAGYGGAVWTAHDEAAPPSSAGERPVVKSEAGVALVEKIGAELSVALEALSAVSIRAQQLEVEPAIVEQFATIRGSTEAAMGAIADLVDFSRLSGGIVLRKERFALRAAIAQLVERLVPDAEERGCRLRIRVEQDVPDALEGDVARLQLALKNLLANAFANAAGGEATLQITPEYTTGSGIQLSFGVAAPGAAKKERTQGGMGMAVARFMVAAMGGEIRVGRKAGEPLYGFTVEFPVLPAQPAPRRPSYVSLVGLTVLVVSADPAQRLAVSNLLRASRMVPLEADNAAMALALLERLEQEGNPVPLVILSNRLPVQDGFLLAFRIRQHARLAPTLVMMLASEGKPGDALACRENGISAYMRYPINERQLNEAIVAVTGASVDADETPTLVTRHSLREQRKGASLLLVDPSRDSQILVAHVLGRHDCSVVVAHDAAEASAALDQDYYDIVLVDTALEGLGGADAGRMLRARIARDPDAVLLVAASLDHDDAYREAKVAAGFDAAIPKPFRREDLLLLLTGRREPAGAV
ncbi:MAG TPA: response regulator [Usitatibacter sp.]|nr:response regulator [Usitatibacter sp.]